MKYKYNSTGHFANIISEQKELELSAEESLYFEKAVNLLVQNILVIAKNRGFKTLEMFPKSLFVCCQEKVTAEFRFYDFYLTELKSEEVKISNIKQHMLIFGFSSDGQLESHCKIFSKYLKYCYSKDEYSDLYKQLSQYKVGEIKGKILEVLKSSISKEESKVFNSYMQYLHRLYAKGNKSDIGKEVIEAYSNIRKIYIGDEAFYEENFSELSSVDKRCFAITVKGVIRTHLSELHTESLYYGGQFQSHKDIHISSEVSFFGSCKEDPKGKEEKSEKDKENIDPISNNIPSDEKPKKQVRWADNLVSSR